MDTDRPEVSLQEIDMILKDILHPEHLEANTRYGPYSNGSIQHNYRTTLITDGLTREDVPDRDSDGSAEFWRRFALTLAVTDSVLKRAELPVEGQVEITSMPYSFFVYEHMPAGQDCTEMIRSTVKEILDLPREQKDAFFHKVLDEFEANLGTRLRHLPYTEELWERLQEYREALNTDHSQTPSTRAMEMQPAERVISSPPASDRSV